MNTSNAFVDQKLCEELRELVKDYVSPDEAFDKILVRLWKNPKAAGIRERLRRQGGSDDRINREVFRKILRQARLRELVSELQGVAMSFKAAAVVVTYGDGRGAYVQADHSETSEGSQRVLQELVDYMEAGAVPLGIVGVAADGLVCARPLREFVGRAEVLASLERAGANISRQNPPASAN
jgi:hypothetical protein